MLFRSMLALACVVSFVLCAPPAGAQAAPVLPLLESSFTPTGVEPDPCFEFGCFNGSVLDHDTLATSGASFPGVYVFAKDRSGTWVSRGVLVNPELPNATDDRSFGAHLALSGDDLLISGTASGASKLYVFRRRGSTFGFRQALSVDVSTLRLGEDTALVGTGQDVRVFEKGRRGDYRLEAVLRAPDTADTSFGATLGLDGNTALIGAPGVSAAYAFERFCSRWVLVQKFTPSSGATEGGFATALAIDRERIAIGAPSTPGALVDRPGVVHLYLRRGFQWRLDHTIANPFPDDGNVRQFGTALDLQGRRLLVSGFTSYPFARGVPVNYLFDLGDVVRPVAVLDAGDATSVQLSGRSALVDVTGFHFGTTPEIFDLTP